MTSTHLPAVIIINMNESPNKDVSIAPAVIAATEVAIPPKLSVSPPQRQMVGIAPSPQQHSIPSQSTKTRRTRDDSNSKYASVRTSIFNKVSQFFFFLVSPINSGNPL
jgi:hypothetical protein